MNNNRKLYLVLLIILAFILRVYQVGSIPPALYWDEAAMALDAKSIVQTGRDQHGNIWFQAIYPSWGDYKLPVYIISAVPFFWIFKDFPELAVRLPSVLAGTLTVLVVYFLAKELFKKFTPENSSSTTFEVSGLKFEIRNSKFEIGLIASLLLAISPWHLQFSRAAFEGNLALFFNTLAILFFLKARKNLWWLVPFSVTTTLGVYTYYSARIILPLIIFIMLIIFWKKNWLNLFALLGSVAIILIFCLPLKNAPIAKQAEQFRLSTKNIFNDSKILIYSNELIAEDQKGILAKKIHHRFIYQGKALASNVFKQLSLNYLLLAGDPNLRHSTGKIGVMLIIGFLGFLIGEYYLFKNYLKLALFLNLSLLISFLPACVPYEVPHSLRSLNGILFLNIISAYGLVLIIKNLVSQKHFLILFTIYCLLFTQIFLYFHDYYKHYPTRSYFSWQGGYREAVLELNEEYNSANEVIFTNAYSRPYLYFLLYSNFPVNQFQKNRQEVLAKNPLDFSETNKIDKVFFNSIDFEKDSKSDKVILIGTPQEIPNGESIDKQNAFVKWKNY